MDLELTSKVVLVSGASRGIGLSIAQRFAAEGCIVALAARNLAGLTLAQQTIATPSSIHVADATDAAACVALVGEVVARWGQLDVLVTCAGSGASVPPGQESANEWQKMIAENLFSATNMISAATPALVHAAPSAIVCISSVAGREALGAPVTYSAAKAALDMTVNGLARPLAARGVRINAISPGHIHFKGGVWDRREREHPERIRHMLETEVPQGVFGTPEAIADATVFLASTRSGFTTGANLVIDGGLTRS